jgi:hypothetical protein
MFGAEPPGTALFLFRLDELVSMGGEEIPCRLFQEQRSRAGMYEKRLGIYPHFIVGKKRKPVRHQSHH